MKQSLALFVAFATSSTAVPKPDHQGFDLDTRSTTQNPSSVFLRRDSECTSSINCVTGQCCSQYGYCGTGPAYCGASTGKGVQGSNGYSGDAINSENANGSIYRFGDAYECHRFLREDGACGISTYFQNVSPDSSFVAMPAGFFDEYGSAQHNILCGKRITLTHNGVTRTAVVADRNLSNDNSIDMCLDLWTAFGGYDNDGTVIHDISFDIVM